MPATIPCHFTRFHWITRLIPLVLLLVSNGVMGQQSVLTGRVSSGGQPLFYARVSLLGTDKGTYTDSTGYFRINQLPSAPATLLVTAFGYQSWQSQLKPDTVDSLHLAIELLPLQVTLNEVVISGTLKEVSRLESPVPVEVYTSRFFQSNPTPTVFDALQNVNGVRPQINCNVCNTGDIHINGLEGPYTLVMIDGMPIVSGLSTVYGLFGIPQALIDRVEIVKGPASTLYGSEAVGGLINVITKNPNRSPLLSADLMASSWGEFNADISGKIRAGKKAQALVGMNYFNYSVPTDKNGDSFTDLTLQNRVSLFNKWNIERNHNRLLTFAGRVVWEDRWGGQMNWTPAYRGSDSIYAESILTRRWELLGTYQLPVREKVLFQFSANDHHQNSVYGNLPYIARQRIAFSQLVWDKKAGRQDLLFGATYRFTGYDDNTPATARTDASGVLRNYPSYLHLPGIFMQDEIRIRPYKTLLLGVRYDYNSVHGNIVSPRVNYKWTAQNSNRVLRLSFGNGYRVANVFTEDHAALTGARRIVFLSNLKPETSWNGNLNLVQKCYHPKGIFIGLDVTAFYTWFGNRILPDYITDPNLIIYDNLDGHAVSRGISLNLDVAFPEGWKFLVGVTGMDVFKEENGNREWLLFTERFSGVWNIGYTHPKRNWRVDYTGNVYSPMRLPLLSEQDPRRPYSPWWSIQNIQLTIPIQKRMEVYGGVKNLLNWTPNRGNPFIIARSHDPFDRQVQWDAKGQALVTPENPYGLTFDPTYVYGPNQGIRGFIGIRWNLGGV